jgi:hypothetical protein
VTDIEHVQLDIAQVQLLTARVQLDTARVWFVTSLVAGFGILFWLLRLRGAP